MLLLGQDADRGVDPIDELVERVAEQPAPVRADVAELAGQGIRRVASRLAEQIQERDGAVRGLAFAVRVEDGHGLMALDGAQGAGEGRLGQPALIDEIAQGRCRRVRVGQVDEQEVLEAGRLGLVDAREVAREPAEQVLRLTRPELLPDGGQRCRDRDLRTTPCGLLDRQVGDLVEQAQGEQLARQRLTLARLSRRVHPPDDRPCGRRPEGVPDARNPGRA